MNAIEFRAFLDLLMCSDSWPVHNEHGGESGYETMREFADITSRDYGFADWIDAYHRHVA